MINTGGGPTPDKPDVILEPPSDPSVVDSFLNVRVADLEGAQFITEPLNNHGAELRCYLRDPDGHLIEVGQTLAAADAPR
ncbi:MAG: hypothetical protein JO120_11540 [Solirubrobacterales bacterium]|nr:hypothetical protein [Solirubrobacterales bacterium]MBV8943283.1 hypothetical protein [Solirubrobacterales bacterium]